ncbi:MAG: flagellar FliJ family protein [Phycisphaerales bacterium]|nr:flagellar FliJ family protein [Phycisphaerales bacterium]
MAKFRFRLQPLLDLRERVERDRRLEVASIEGERRLVEGEIAGFQSSIRAIRAELSAALSPSGGGGGGGGAGVGGSVDVRSARMQMNAVLALQVKAQQAAIRLAGIVQRLEAARSRLLEAARDRRAVELLREKRLAAWKDELRRREAAANDELAVMRSGRSD